MTTLPLRSLIKLTGLNGNGLRYSDRISTIKSTLVGSDYKLEIKVPSNFSYQPATPVAITGLVGLPDPYSTTVDSVSGTDTIVLIGAQQLEYSVERVETFKVGSTYYMRVFVTNSITINQGTTLELSSLPSPLSPANGSVLTVASATPYSILFSTTDATPFGISSTYFPEIYSVSLPPNTYPSNLPLNTSSPSAIVSVIDTNGFITSSLTVAMVSPGSLDTYGYLTDHNRSALQVSYDEIETVERTVDGSLRYHFNASKRTFNVSWNLIPADTSATVDGNWGGNDILNVYKNNKGVFTLEIYNRESARKTSSGPDTVAQVRFSSVSYDIVKRNFVLSGSGQLSDLWNVTISLEEV